MKRKLIFVYLTLCLFVSKKNSDKQILNLSSEERSNEN